MRKIIDGKKISAELKQQIAAETKQFIEKTKIIPGLAVILVGDNPASQVYVRNKESACIAAGMYSKVIRLEEKTTSEELLSYIDSLNVDKSIHGILVQLPLPSHINEEDVINRIIPEKDVDAFHPINVGKIMTGNFNMLPCTPAGVMELLKYENIDICGKKCVVVGRSNIVGKPMAMLLLHANGTVTIAHSRTKNLSEITKDADILVAAVGRPKFITSDMIKEGAVVIDVGINRGEDGKLCGDVDYENCVNKASYITPVPGGVGPMTITMLLRNTLTAAITASEK